MDIVRGIHFVGHNSDTMASISEDCTVKLWSIKAMQGAHAGDQKGNIEPFFTMRGHTGPLFACTGNTSASQLGGNLIFTAGMEGQIRVWTVPAESEVNGYGDTYDGKNYCIGVWSDIDQEAFWDLKYHPF
jgi:striatin 1/3/4